MAVPQAQLTEAFQAFNQLAAELSDSYVALQQRVVSLQQELAAARSDRLKQLAEKEHLAERLAHLLEILPGAVVVLDGSAVVRQTNRLAEEWLGEPLRGLTWKAVAARALRLGPSGNVVLNDGRALNVSTRELDSEPGSIILITDETETRRLEEVASRNERLAAMGEMVARLAHQIRTPLASAVLYVSHINSCSPATAEHGALADKGLSCLRRLERMVNDMLVFARGGIDASEVVPAATLLADLRAAVTPQLVGSAARLVLTNHSEGACLHGHREALLSVLLNLVDNALQACGGGGTVEVSAGPPENGRLTLAVTDDGPGIEQGAQSRMFEPFFTTRAQGTGLGLAVVRAVVTGYGGDIDVDSDSGAGTRIALTLPCAQDRPGLLASGERGALRARGELNPVCERSAGIGVEVNA